MQNVVCKILPCVVRPYLDPSLSTRAAGAGRVDGTGAQMQARQLAHDRAYRVRTRSGCAGVSCVSRLAVDHRGHLLGSC
jgi:hypothetical protein